MPTVDCGFHDTPTRSGQNALIALGPTLPVQVGFDPAFRPDGNTAVNLPPDQFPALVDTGASISCIDSSLAVTLNLPIVDRQKVAGAHGSREVNMHLAQIYIPSLACTIHGEFAGVDLVVGGQLHHALIGRMFLQHFTMTYEGRTGAVQLSNDKV